MVRIFTLFFVLIMFGFTQVVAQPSTVVIGTTILDVRIVIEGTNETNGIDIPWEIQWGPDNFIWMTERYGRVSRLNPETGSRVTILDLSNSVYANSESGLLGLQLHPDFENTPQVFLAYTYFSSGIKERIVRYDYNSVSGILENPLTLVEGINGNTTHIGCRLLILPDNTLLATTGDYQNQSSPQSENSVSGKILRMNLDGSIPSDNPFGPTSYLYSIGHRNAQGLVLAPNGKIYSSEHGPLTNDEFNIVEAGGNYGWPDVEGFCNESGEMADCNSMTNYQDPLAIWYENSTIAPSDLIWYDHPAIPEWQGKMLMTVLKAEHLKVIEVDNVDGTTVVNQEILFNDPHANNPSSFNQGLFDRLRDVCMSPDGRVFLATNGPSWGVSETWQNSIIELKNSAYNPTSLNEEIQVSHTQVYPNPSNGITSLVFSKELVGSDFTVCDRTGRMIYSGLVIGKKIELDLSDLASGLYLLRAANGNYLTTERILIQ